MNKTVVVAMSGGVDSSVAAALLLKKGYKVIGLTMRLWSAQKFDGPTVAETDAAAVAKLLGIEHHVVDLTERFRQTVVAYFLEEYALGHTPNPCVFCNQKIKFGTLYERALELGADYLSTGHYVKLATDGEGKLRIARARCLPKDQSYVLYHLNQEILHHVLFPLGEAEDKDHVRTLAHELNLPVFAKKDSQEICFIPDNDHHRFLQQFAAAPEKPGNFVTATGQVLGHHKGLSHYTVGQRKGLGLAAAEPLFVLDIDKKRNQVVVGFAAEAACRGLVARNVVFSDGAVVQEPLAVQVKIRYNAKPVAATIEPMSGAGYVKVLFQEPLRGIAPGQFAVFYQGELCLGGGVIVNSLKA